MEAMKMGPDKCPKCHQTSHPNGCPGSLPRPRVSDMSDTREAEGAIAQHGFGPSDADQLTAARQEIDELRAEVAKLLTDLRDSLKHQHEAQQDRDACRQIIRDLYCRLGLDGFVKTIAAAEAQIQEARIPF